MTELPALILFDGKTHERAALLRIFAELRMHSCALSYAAYAHSSRVEIARLELENRVLRAWLWLKEEDHSND